MSEDRWDLRPRGSCSACGQLTTVVMGDRGPVKVDLEMERIGHFRFCSPCLLDSESGQREAGGNLESWIRITRGPAAGHLWITSVI